MRYAVISDIHGNLPAWEGVREALAGADIDAYLCLGDIVDYGPWPNECCRVIRELGAICVRGNHDEAIVHPELEEWFNPEARACLRWTRAQLTEENRDFLASLEPIRQLDELTLCHGSIPDPNYYITSSDGALPSLQAMDGSLAFFGHTHYAEWYGQQEDGTLPQQHSCPAGCVCSLEAGGKYLINPGAVGQPRDGNPQAAFAIYDQQAEQVELRRVDYDITAAQQQMRAAGLPPSMSLRLSHGV